MIVHADGRPNMNKMMRVTYKDANGEPVSYNCYPDVLEGKKYGTVNAQFETGFMCARKIILNALNNNT